MANEDRRKGVGASDVAAILGVPGTYSTAHEIWLEKTGRAVEQPKPLDLFEVGNALEPAVVLYGERIIGETGGHAPDFIRHPNGILQGHADWLTERHVVEGKVIVHGKAPPNGKLQWEFQARTYMLLWDRPHAVLPMLDIPQSLPAEAIGMVFRLMHDPAALLDALLAAKWARFSHVLYDRDPRIDTMILDRTAAWWERHVVDDVPVPPDGSEGARLHLLDAHPPPPKDERVIRRADDLQAIAEEYADASRREKEAAGEKDRLGQELMAAIGDDHGIRGDGWQVTWSRFSRTKIDWDRLRAERPDVGDVIDEYKGESPSGRLYVRTNKGEAK